VHLARVFAHGPEKRFFRFSIKSCDFQVQAHFRLPALFVQQQSGDWAMAGKVPVARVEGQELLPTPIGRMNHPAHQNHGRIAGR